MRKVKHAITKNEFQQLTKDILSTLQDKKNQFCKSNYTTLLEARGMLYTMMTGLIVQKTGSILDHNISMKQDERIIVKDLISKLKYKTDREKEPSAAKGKLIQDLTMAKKNS